MNDRITSYIRMKMYSWAFEKRDYSRIDKIMDGIESGKVTAENYWEAISKFSRSSQSCHTIHRWEHIAECIERDVAMFKSLEKGIAAGEITIPAATATIQDAPGWDSFFTRYLNKPLTDNTTQYLFCLA